MRSSRTRKTHVVTREAFEVNIGDGARTRDTVVVLGAGVTTLGLSRIATVLRYDVLEGTVLDRGYAVGWTTLV